MGALNKHTGSNLHNFWISLNKINATALANLTKCASIYRYQTSIPEVTKVEEAYGGGISLCAPVPVRCRGGTASFWCCPKEPLSRRTTVQRTGANGIK